MHWRELRTIVLVLASASWLPLTGCRVGDADKTPTQSPNQPPAIWLEDITTESGIEFTHDVGTERRYFFPEIMAPGAAFLDYDQDGDLDIYLLNGGTVLDDPSIEKAQQPTNRLFRQEPSGRFVDVTAGSGLDDPGYGMGVAVGDINNDGYPDVYVTNYGQDRLFLNRADGTFADITERAGIDNARWSASASFVDFDRDGWLDLFVTNYVDYHRFHPCSDASGRRDYCNPADFPGTPDVLYQNVSARLPPGTPEKGDGQPADIRFADVSLSSRIAEKSGAGLGVVCADFTGDGWTDIYVANDEDANALWVNQCDGTFRDEAVLFGTAYDALGRAQAGMGIALGEINGDETFDLLLTHLHGESNAVYLSSQDATFHESAREVGIATASFPYTGFGAALVDFEHDGDLDLAVANGRVRRRFEKMPKSSAGGSASPFWEAYSESNQLFVNDDGQFQPQNEGPFCDRAEVSRALAFGDIDNDGDMDLLMTNSGGPARLFRNDSTKQGHWLLVRTVDPALGGRDAYGSVVTVYSDGRKWRRLANPGSSYLASHDARVHFGLGKSSSVERIEVLWPDGNSEIFSAPGVDRILVLKRGQGNLP